MPADSGKVHRTMLKQYDDQYRSHTMPTDPGKAHCTTPHLYIQRTVQFQYCAHRFKEYNDHGTACGTTDDFFQHHHTLHSYDWKNDNETDQSSTSTSRHF